MKNLYKYIVVSLLAMLIYLPVTAQITTKDETLPQPTAPNAKPDKTQGPKSTDKFWGWDKFYVGGIPGFGISDYYLTVSVAAEAGYFVHPHIALGIQMDYSYVLDKTIPGENISYNVIRFGPYARGYIWKGIFAQAEYELTTIKNYQYLDETQSPPVLQVVPRLNNNSLLLGGGYHDNFENGFGFYFAVLFNVINASSALSTNPEFQVGLTYRFNGGGYHNKRPKKNRMVGSP